jgi:hypothetical protein
VGGGIVVPVVLFACVAAVLVEAIVTRHKERMAMIEKGMAAEEIKSLYARPTGRGDPLASMKWGIIFIGTGVAILLGMWLRETYLVSEGVFPGLIALLAGLGLIIFYFLAKRRAS